jgi:hypothetical protein
MAVERWGVFGASSGTLYGANEAVTGREKDCDIEMFGITRLRAWQV